MCLILMAVGFALAAAFWLNGHLLYAAAAALVALGFGALMVRNILKVRRTRREEKRP